MTGWYATAGTHESGTNCSPTPGVSGSGCVSSWMVRNSTCERPGM